MLTLEVKSNRDIDTLRSRIKNYFGPGGLGLELTGDTLQCISFEGGGGYVTATLCPEGDTTRVELETREWDYHVKKFAAEIQ